MYRCTRPNLPMLALLRGPENSLWHVLCLSNAVLGMGLTTMRSRALGWLKTTIFLFLCSICTLAFAAHREQACLKYAVNYGWSQPYEVDAEVISGMDLNTAVGSYTRFKGFATYAVIFWSQDQASIFELPPYAIGQLPIVPTEVQDQTGRLWKISADNGVCI